MLRPRALFSIGLLSGVLLCPTLWAQGQQTLGGLRVERMHIIIESRPAELQVAEMYVFARAGPQEGGGALLRFTLPPDATDLRFSGGEQGGRYRQVEGGFVDTVPFPLEEPSHQVLFSYKLPHKRSTLMLTRTVHYPVASLNVLLPAGRVSLSAPGLIFAGEQRAQDRPYQNFVASDAAAEEPIVLVLSNLPVDGEQSAPTTGGTMLGMALALLTLGVGAGVTAPLWYRRGSGERCADD